MPGFVDMPCASTPKFILLHPLDYSIFCSRPTHSVNCRLKAEPRSLRTTCRSFTTVLQDTKAETCIVKRLHQVQRIRLMPTQHLLLANSWATLCDGSGSSTRTRDSEGDTWRSARQIADGERRPRRKPKPTRSDLLLLGMHNWHPDDGAYSRAALDVRPKNNIHQPTPAVSGDLCPVHRASL